jgi:1,4-dihydroxy-2-naphthoyl-CoA hydrolase
MPDAILRWERDPSDRERNRGDRNGDPGGEETGVPASSELMQRMGIEIVERSGSRVVATMPVAGNRQGQGVLNGGASCVLAESIGSYAANLNAGPDAYALGVDINATHHRAVRDGVVTGVATPLHLGRRIATYDVRILDEEDRPVCTARVTCLIVARREGEDSGR